jgi:hypothetical protein
MDGFWSFGLLTQAVVMKRYCTAPTVTEWALPTLEKKRFEYLVKNKLGIRSDRISWFSVKKIR